MLEPITLIPVQTGSDQTPSMLLAIIILVLLSALVATDPDTPGGGQ